MKYVAGLMGKQVDIEAPSLWDAKRKAIDALQPKRKQLGLVWVLPVKEVQMPNGEIVNMADAGQLN